MHLASTCVSQGLAPTKLRTSCTDPKLNKCAEYIQIYLLKNLRHRYEYLLVVLDKDFIICTYINFYL